MSDVGWRADGLARARAAGGVDLERYRRPGFTGGWAVRIAGTAGGEGFEYDGYEDPDYDPEGLLRTRLPDVRAVPHPRPPSSATPAKRARL